MIVEKKTTGSYYAHIITAEGITIQTRISYFFANQSHATNPQG